jgi:uncharacterized iron-regulated membrane protein
MSVWKQWLRQPQRVWLRRALFQIHLWTGLALGLYVVVLSVTGSALVYRGELVTFFRTPVPRADPSLQRLSTDELRASAQRAYPDHQIAELRENITRRTAVAQVTVERNGEIKERLFNPYTGEDLGDAFTRGERAVLWTVRLHDDLLYGSSGRYWNGVLSAFVTLLCLTGAVVWWPGVNRWRRSLIVKSHSGWRRFTWDLHSALGAWLFLFILMWGVSGFYMGVPEPFVALVDYVSDPDPELLGERPGDVALAWLSRLHFGRWQSGSLKALWAVIGFVPAIMFITGAIMWWNRVVRKRPARNVAESPLAEPVGSSSSNQFSPRSSG